MSVRRHIGELGPTGAYALGEAHRRERRSFVNDPLWINVQHTLFTRLDSLFVGRHHADPIKDTRGWLSCLAYFVARRFRAVTMERVRGWAMAAPNDLWGVVEQYDALLSTRWSVVAWLVTGCPVPFKDAFRIGGVHFANLISQRRAAPLVGEPLLAASSLSYFTEDTSLFEGKEES